MRFMLVLVTIIAVTARSTFAVLNGEAGTGGYRYNGPAHKYLPATSNADSTTNYQQQQHQQQQQRQPYHGPSHRYLPVALPLVTEPTKTHESTGATYGFKSPRPSYAYKGPYNMQHYEQQPQQQQQNENGVSNAIPKEHEQSQSSYSNSGSTGSYYVPQQSLHDQRDTYYVPLSYNQHNKAQAQVGYTYAPSSSHSQQETGYRYETPNAIAATSGYNYRAPNEQQLSGNHGHFQSESIVADYVAPSASAVSAHGGQTFSFSDDSSNAANYQTNLEHVGHKQTQTSSLSTAGGADYLQMQSHSYQLPSYYTMQREWPQHQHQQHQHHPEAPQQQHAAAGHLTEQTTYNVYPSGTGSSYTPPSLEFQPPYY